MGFGLLVAILDVAAGGKAILFDTIDPDCFWHLKVAEQLHAEGIRPIVDRLSFASIREPWSPYSWLAELGMKSIWDAGGFRLAVAVQAAMQAAFLLLMALACRRTRRALPADARLIPTVDALSGSRIGRPSHLACAVSAAAMGFISLPYLSFRPVTAALVLLAICVLLIVRDRARDERTELVWLTPLITVLIVNLHLYAVFVPAFFGVLLIGAMWERFVSQPAEQIEACRRCWRLFVLTLLCGVACCATPMLPGMIQTALHYQATDPMVAGGYIAEMRPFFLGTFGTASAAIVGLMLLAILIRLPLLRAGERLWLALSVLALSQWGRFAPVFAITASPMIAVVIGKLSDRPLARLPMRLALATLLVIALIRVGGEFPSPSTPLNAWINRHGPDAPTYPNAAAQYLATHVKPRTGKLVSEFAWGGYLEWSVGDRYQLLLDGRTQLFTPDFWQSTYLNGEEERSKFFTQIDADAAVLPRASMFRHTLVKQGWKSVWRDDQEGSEVLLPPARQAVAKTQATPDTAAGKAKRSSVLSALFPE
jgi:hypothetical protein